MAGATGAAVLVRMLQWRVRRVGCARDEVLIACAASPPPPLPRFCRACLELSASRRTNEIFEFSGSDSSRSARVEGEGE